jgi:hypothetical protein
MDENLHRTKRALGVAPGVYKSGVSPTSIAIDTMDFDKVTVDLLIGAVTDSQTLTFQESDVVGSGYADVPDANVIGNQATFKAAVQSGNANTVQSIGYIGRKQFLKVGATGAGTTGGAFAVVAELGGARKQPATATLA